MRAIKFRAWDKENQSMLDDITTWTDDYTDMLNETIKYKQNNSVELMQFTGLHDKNGKEIFEGDIIRAFEGHAGPHSEVYGVRWNSGFCGFEANCVTDHFIMKPSFSDQYEVIGNIYENPELLK